MLNWIKKYEWIKNYHAIDNQGEEVALNSPDAVSWDLYGALRISYFDDDEFYQAIEKVKRVIKQRFPEKWNKHVKTTYYKEDGKLIFVDPPLYKLNDELDNFQQLQRILFYLD